MGKTLSKLFVDSANSTLLQFFRNALVGSFAFVLELGLMYLLTECAYVYYLWSSVFSSLCAGGINYLLCSFWVFNQTKVKNKETGVDELINQTVTVNKKTAENVLPELKAISGNNSKYTINTMGTKELYSPKIGFLQKGSNNFENFQEELSLYSSNPSFDSKLLDVNEAKKTAKQLVLNNGIKKNSELAQQLEQIVDLVFSPNVYNNIRTSVYYRNSANSDNGRGYIGVNSRTKGNLFNISLTNKHSLDEEVQLNEFLPQVIYSRAMIEKLTEMAVESQQAGKLVMSPELQKLINANG